VTTDFFPPVVDDPYDFGAVAAANALSDIYAMGGKPLFAVNLVAFPDGLDLDYLREILRGGAEKVAEAGAAIAGGHSVNDKEPKYGLAVIGMVNPAAIIPKSGSQPGDKIVLTKPLGTGVITTAIKRQQADPDSIAAAVDSMKRLNDRAAQAAQAAGVKSMTDVTGFGLLGHAHEMAHLSGVNLRFKKDAFPWLPGAIACGAAGAFPGGKGNNEHYFSPWVKFGDSVEQLWRDLLWTPETSGGLLAAVPPGAVPVFQDHFADAVIIGEVLEGDGHIEVV
jgi:selenide,water dikinase